jgi:hypothetical protein
MDVVVDKVGDKNFVMRREVPDSTKVVFMQAERGKDEASYGQLHLGGLWEGIVEAVMTGTVNVENTVVWQNRHFFEILWNTRFPTMASTANRRNRPKYSMDTPRGKDKREDLRSCCPHFSLTLPLAPDASSYDELALFRAFNAWDMFTPEERTYYATKGAENTFPSCVNEHMPDLCKVKSDNLMVMLLAMRGAKYLEGTRDAEKLFKFDTMLDSVYVFCHDVALDRVPKDAQESVVALMDNPDSGESCIMEFLYVFHNGFTCFDPEKPLVRDFFGSVTRMMDGSAVVTMLLVPKSHEFLFDDDADGMTSQRGDRLIPCSNVHIQGLILKVSHHTHVEVANNTGFMGSSPNPVCHLIFDMSDPVLSILPQPDDAICHRIVGVYAAAKAADSDPCLYADMCQLLMAAFKLPLADVNGKDRFRLLIRTYVLNCLYTAFVVRQFRDDADVACASLMFTRKYDPDWAPAQRVVAKLGTAIQKAFVRSRERSIAQLLMDDAVETKKRARRAKPKSKKSSRSARGSPKTPAKPLLSRPLDNGRGLANVLIVTDDSDADTCSDDDDDDDDVAFAHATQRLQEVKESKEAREAQKAQEAEAKEKRRLATARAEAEEERRVAEAKEKQRLATERAARAEAERVATAREANNQIKTSQSPFDYGLPAFVMRGVSF